MPFPAFFTFSRFVWDNFPMWRYIPTYIHLPNLYIGVESTLGLWWCSIRPNGQRTTWGNQKQRLTTMTVYIIYPFALFNLLLCVLNVSVGSLLLLLLSLFPSHSLRNQLSILLDMAGWLWSPVFSCFIRNFQCLCIVNIVIYTLAKSIYITILHRCMHNITKL